VSALDIAPVKQDRKAPPDDRLRHIVTDRDKVRQAMVEGTPVTALCGKVWVPRRWKPRDTQLCVVCEGLARRQYPSLPF